MTVSKPVGSLAYVVVNTRDQRVAVAFWQAVLGREVGKAEFPFTDLVAPGELTVSIQQVERYRGGHEIHIDLRVADLEVAVAEVERLGGRLVKRWPDDWRCATMSDPDGNHFCLVVE